MKIGRGSGCLRECPAGRINGAIIAAASVFDIQEDPISLCYDRNKIRLIEQLTLIWRVAYVSLLLRFPSPVSEELNP
jgi:hypothetical protein